MQADSLFSESAVFRRLRQLQVSEGMTWSNVAKRLGISVSMLMMVKRGKRNLSAKALYRLEQAEHEVADRKSRTERVVEELLVDQGPAAQVVGRESRKTTKRDLKVEYSSRLAAKSLPEEVTLWKPTEQSCTQLRQLFTQTMDTVVILLACLPDVLRSEKFLSQLATDSRVRLTNAALDLVIPEWRMLAVKITKPSR